MALCVGAIQQTGEGLEMRWTDIRDGAVFVRQSKTRKELWIPILDEQRAALGAALRHSVYILTYESETKCWSDRGASAAVQKVTEQPHFRARATQLCEQNKKQNA